MEPADWKNIAMQAAIDAGKAILDVYEQDFEVEYKADESPLTAADKAGHHLIVDALEPTGFPVLSEESAAVSFEERKGWSTYWLVDPLDGTKEFIKKNGEFTVNIALIREGKPVFGVVYVPVEDTLYCGVLDGESEPAAWKATACRGKTPDELIKTAEPLSVSGYALKSETRPMRVVASKSHCNDETLEFIREIEEGRAEAERVSRGSSLKLCMVAEGRADVYPRIAPTMEWDTAAAHAVVQAAGGSVFIYSPDQAATDYSAGNHEIKAVRYNKPDLLNPYFVVSGLHE